MPRIKSDLRWLEAGARGILVIASPDTYPHVRDGHTGFHARDVSSMTRLLLELVDGDDRRTAVREVARV